MSQTKIQTRLYDCPDHERIEQFIADHTEYFESLVTPILGSTALTGAQWYHTPVTYRGSPSKATWKYGIELEIDFVRVTRNGGVCEWEDFPDRTAKIAKITLVGRLKHFASGGGGITLDDSLDRGWELVLPPLSRVKASSLAQYVYKHSFIYPYINHDSKAALHITVDPFDTWLEQHAFHDFWNDGRLFDDFIGVIGREETGYIRQRKRKKTMRNKFMKADDLKDHYNRCNVRGNGAMEVRVFKAVYNKEVIDNQLEMVHCVNVAVRRGLHTYEELKNYLQKRGF